MGWEKVDSREDVLAWFTREVNARVKNTEASCLERKEMKSIPTSL